MLWKALATCPRGGASPAAGPLLSFAALYSPSISSMRRSGRSSRYSGCSGMVSSPIWFGSGSSVSCWRVRAAAPQSTPWITASHTSMICCILMMCSPMRMLTTAMAETYAPEQRTKMTRVCFVRSLMAARMRGLLRRRRMPRVRFARFSATFSGDMASSGGTSQFSIGADSA